MTTITRSQLQDAIKAGITVASELNPGFTADHAEALWAVGGRARVVARGTFKRGPYDGDEAVQCPVALAFPDWMDKDRVPWDVQTFCTAYDRVTWIAIGMPVGVGALCVIDDDSRGVAT